jgi:hypothetical protein
MGGGHSSMTIELPVFLLGFGGFPAAQQQAFGRALQSASGPTQWLASDLAGADAWWINGARLQMAGDRTVRVPPGNPTERSLQLYLPDIDRPVAFSLPAACPGFQPALTFDPQSQASMDRVLGKFDASLSALTAQFCLASHIVEHQTALGTGIFDVSVNGSLIAVVDMKGDIGVVPNIGPADLEQSIWQRRPEALPIPQQFVRTSLSQLIWQYAVRTQRDILPPHYRKGLLYFRRPPRLSQRMLKDSHLLLMRELAMEPMSFPALMQQTGMDEAALSRGLAALYFVGAVTANPKRAALNHRPQPREHAESVAGPHSGPPSSPDTVVPLPAPRRPRRLDLTAPAALHGY